MTRPRGFIESWRPQKRTLVKIDALLAVIEEFAAHLPLTIRQIFYRLVAKEIIGKTENSYDSLLELIGNMRRNQRIEMNVIRDDGSTNASHLSLGDYSLEDHLMDIKKGIENFRLDRQMGQDERLVIWAEAAGMVPQLRKVASPYGVTVQTSGGFDSLTTKHDLGNAAGFGFCGHPLRAYYQPTHVLHIGDFDPSGECMYDALKEDAEAFAMYHDRELRFTRLAVTDEQVDLYDLPTAPPKSSSHQACKQMTHTVQCEALDPATLANIVRTAIESNLCLTTIEGVKQREIECRVKMMADFPASWEIE